MKPFENQFGSDKLNAQIDLSIQSTRVRHVQISWKRKTKEKKNTIKKIKKKKNINMRRKLKMCDFFKDK